MKKRSQTFLIFGSLMALLLLDSPSWLPLSDAFVVEANAIIGRPITPVSYAGVARRTSRRVVRRNVAYSSAAVGTTYTTTPAPAQPASPADRDRRYQLPRGACRARTTVSNTTIAAAFITGRSSRGTISFTWSKPHEARDDGLP